MNESIRLSSIVVYNATLGPKEGEEEKKLLYYYPEGEAEDRKVNNVGLCQALVQFTRTMSPGEACDTLHTQNQHYLFHEPEENFWMVLALANPVHINSAGKSEMKEFAINDAVYHAILKDIYKRFRFLHGTFLHILDFFQVNDLKSKLKAFFREMIPGLKLSKCDLLKMYNGLVYCNVDKPSILAFQSFINSVQDKCKNIKYSLILSDMSLVLTDLSKHDSQILISLLKEKLQKRVKAVSKSAAIYQFSHGKFVGNLFPGTDNMVFVSTRTGRIEQMNILIYQAFNITTCFLLDYLDVSLVELSKSLDMLIGPLLLNLAKKLPTNSHKYIDGLDPHVKHVFFNQETLAVESSCHGATVNSCSVPTDIMQVVNDIAGQRPSERHQDEEIINKVQNDHWVASKKTNQKELYVVVNSKNANLIAINDDVRKMSHHFDNICFSD